MEFAIRFLQIPNWSCRLLGRCGIGKPGWLRDRLFDVLCLDLLESALHRSLIFRPERHRELLAGSPEKGATVVLGGFQRTRNSSSWSTPSCGRDPHRTPSGSHN